jgi:hypothetical protein
MESYKRNRRGVWYNDDADRDDPAGKYAFQRLRHTWFTPKLDPKFTCRRDDKFYAFGSCFARGIEHSLTRAEHRCRNRSPGVSPSMAYVKHQASPRQIALYRRQQGQFKSEPPCSETPQIT